MEDLVLVLVPVLVLVLVLVHVMRRLGLVVHKYQAPPLKLLKFGECIIALRVPHRETQRPRLDCRQIDSHARRGLMFKKCPLTKRILKQTEQNVT